jgi:hypothetical protein
VVVLLFLCSKSWTQSRPVRGHGTPPCAVTEDSIFKDARICGKSREGSLSRTDLTVAGFTIGGSTLEDVAKLFPGSHQFRLTKEMALWLTEKSGPEDGKGWIVVSGACGGSEMGVSVG